MSEFKDSEKACYNCGNLKCPYPKDEDFSKQTEKDPVWVVKKSCWSPIRDIFEIMTFDEIAELKRTQNCPICGFEFVGYPTGWAWQNHIRDCLTERGRS